jgi:hypothetical protein
MAGSVVSKRVGELEARFEAMMGEQQAREDARDARLSATLQEMVGTLGTTRAPAAHQQVVSTRPDAISNVLVAAVTAVLPALVARISAPPPAVDPLASLDRLLELAERLRPDPVDLAPLLPLAQMVAARMAGPAGPPKTDA